MVGRYLKDRQHEPVQVYENTDWILVPIEVKSQETLFGLGF